MHGHCATVLIIAGRSATIGTVVENVGVVINFLCLLLSLSLSLSLFPSESITIKKIVNSPFYFIFPRAIINTNDVTYVYM